MLIMLIVFKQFPKSFLFFYVCQLYAHNILDHCVIRALPFFSENIDLVSHYSIDIFTHFLHLHQLFVILGDRFLAPFDNILTGHFTNLLYESLFSIHLLLYLRLMRLYLRV
jgi:hypothetical protein